MEFHKQTVQATLSALLHDVGKIAYRAGQSGSTTECGYRQLKSIWNDSEILNAVRYCHKEELRTSPVEKDSIAYIVYIANRIAAAADYREQSTDTDNQSMSKYLPVSSIFSHMNGNSTIYELPIQALEKSCPIPRECGTYKASESEYKTILHGLMSALKTIPAEREWSSSILALCEKWTSFVPADTDSRENADVSLYDHQKITAAASGCISEYLLEQQETDYRRCLLTEEKQFWNKKAFLLYSADISGIQNFIYTIASKYALKSMRSRSFFLELLMEHYIDEILEGVGLSGSNLLYSGGGHCYLLLPNTEKVRQILQSSNQSMNRWLRQNFGIRLYLADGMTPCSANELTNHPQEESPYKQIFERISRQISQRKIRRYSAKELIELNKSAYAQGGRECKICGASENLIDEKCPWCRLFEALSKGIQNKTVFLVSTQRYAESDFELPHGDKSVYISLNDENTARKRIKYQTDILRVYTKNILCVEFANCRKLYVGDYHISNDMEELATASSGIVRNAVCRMDVDDLGKAFIAGFEQPNQTEDRKYRYVTISRTAAFSRQMSLFFKYYINAVLDKFAVSVIYSGGDDVFLIGAWNHILDAAQKIQTVFSEYTCGTLHLSAGILVHHAKYPIRRAASEAAELEDCAKHQSGKNAVSIFQPTPEHTYSWKSFSEKVVGEKLLLLKKFFDEQVGEDARGKAFLYRLLELLRGSEKQINLARFAYLLTRMEPPRTHPNHTVYQEFSSSMYDWYCKPEERRQLITAIYIYVYLTRMEGEERDI